MTKDALAAEFKALVERELRAGQWLAVCVIGGAEVVLHASISIAVDLPIIETSRCL